MSLLLPRYQERRRPYYEGEKGSWSEAVIEILEQQFSYSRESLQEMLELHDGNLEVALDMLAQLEAENDGQLPASGQVTVTYITSLLGTVHINGSL